MAAAHISHLAVLLLLAISTTPFVHSYRPVDTHQGGSDRSLRTVPSHKIGAGYCYRGPNIQSWMRPCVQYTGSKWSVNPALAAEDCRSRFGGDFTPNFLCYRFNGYGYAGDCVGDIGTEAEVRVPTGYDLDCDLWDSYECNLIFGFPIYDRAGVECDQTHQGAIGWEAPSVESNI